MSNTATPEDAESLSQVESTEEELAHIMRDDNCQVCLSLRRAVPVSVKITYAELQRIAADGCKLCELLQRVSETACTGANAIIQDTDLVHVIPGISGAEESAASLRVETGKGGKFRESFHFRLVHLHVTY